MFVLTNMVDSFLSGGGHATRCQETCTMSP